VHICTRSYTLCITGAAVTWAPGWLSVLAWWESLLPGSAEPLVTMTVLASGDRLWHSYVSFSSVGSQGFVASRQNLRGPRARRLFVVVGLFGFLVTIYLLFGCSLPAKWALQAVCSEFLSIVWLDLAWCWVGWVGCPPMTPLKDRIGWRQWPLQKKTAKKAHPFVVKDTSSAYAHWNFYFWLLSWLMAWVLLIEDIWFYVRYTRGEKSNEKGRGDDDESSSSWGTASTRTPNAWAWRRTGDIRTLMGLAGFGRCHTAQGSKFGLCQRYF